MPFFRRRHSQGVDSKARLEHKLYLARENPDLVFDLSDCDLKSVPKGVYSLCKVLRKESLFLQNNHLSSLSGGGSLEDLHLLQVLDLRSNNLSCLPDAFGTLTNLKELYLNNNMLKTLPECICDLKQLRVLSCSFNKLKRLPGNVTRLQNLATLQLQGNPALCSLPNNLCLLPRLVNLVLDIGRYTHPPDDTVLQGTPAILTYLAKQMGVDYKGPIQNAQDGSLIPVKPDFQLPDDKNRFLEEKVLALEKKKEEKLQEMLDLEKGMAEQKEKEIKLHNLRKAGNDKLMEDLVQQQFKIAEEVVKFQSRKEAERTRLIEHLHQVEEETNLVIKRLMSGKKAQREPWRILERDQEDKVAEEKFLSVHLDTADLRKKEVLNAMEALVAEERERLNRYEQSKAEVIKSTLHRDLEWDEELSALLRDRSAQQTAVVAALAADERAQEAAVATLLERNDLESIRLRAEVGVIEQQLAALTILELKRNKLKVDHLQWDLSEKRVLLSSLLVDALSQQEQRKKQLLRTLRQLELHKTSDEDYWLKQYQKLLDSKGVLDSRLGELMVMYGVAHHMSTVLDSELSTISDHSLTQAGVRDEEERRAIMKVVTDFLSQTKSQPSAPPAIDEASAPPLETCDETECVVCLNSQCHLVFVPCGHLCCCSTCGLQLDHCPLCRTLISRKVRVIPSTTPWKQSTPT